MWLRWNRTSVQRGLEEKVMAFVRPEDGVEGKKNSSAFRHTGPDRNHGFQMSTGSCSEHNFVMLIS